MTQLVTFLFIRLCSKENWTIIIRRRGGDPSTHTGIIREREVAKPKKKKEPPIVNESWASESDSEVDKEKGILLEDEYYDIVIGK